MSTPSSTTSAEQAEHDHAPADVPACGWVPPVALVPIRSYARRAEAEDFTSVRPNLRPIAAWRMDCSRFAFDSSFINPHARHELPELLRLHEEQRDAPVSIFGHTDPTGAIDYNKELSGRRALAVHALLLRDVDEWERLYANPTSGDKWGKRSLQTILAALTDAEGSPYYSGEIDDDFGSGSEDAMARYQAENVDATGAPLKVDGEPGKKSRASMFRRYMDHLCTTDDGRVLELTKENFLARGADPEHRGDVQGCGEFNPLMVFSRDEDAAYQAWSRHAERDEDNSVNRRVVVFLYPPTARVDPERWPCPAARKGAAQCRKRFWSDAKERRSPSALRRHFDGDFDTFGCRFYHYFGNNTPAETPIHLGLTFDIYLHHAPGASPVAGTYRMRSDDEEIDTSRRASDAVILRSDEWSEVRCLSMTGLEREKLYTLSFAADSDGGAFEAVALATEIRLTDYANAGRGRDPSDEGQQVAWVCGDDDYLTYEPSPGTDGELRWDEVGGESHGRR